MSLKVTENGTTGKHGYGFLFAYQTNMAVSVAASTQYTNVTD